MGYVLKVVRRSPEAFAQIKVLNAIFELAPIQVDGHVEDASTRYARRSEKQLTTDPYLDAGASERHYGRLHTMMPSGMRINGAERGIPQRVMYARSAGTAAESSFATMRPKKVQPLGPRCV